MEEPIKTFQVKLAGKDREELERIKEESRLHWPEFILQSARAYEELKK